MNVQRNELRDGNWYLLKTLQNENGYKMKFSFEEHWCYVDGFLGIPLTEDVLKKCGFQKDEMHNCFVLLELGNNDSLEFFDGLVHLVGFNAAEPLEHIKYLHQLQNIIFALDDSELNIQL